jgi:hypothetical protein
MVKYACLFMIAMLLCTGAFAQNASSKATAAINTAVGCTVKGNTNIVGDTVPIECKDVFNGMGVNVTPDNFATVMQAPVKVSNSQSLFVSPSLVAGLYTNTKTKTTTGTSSTAQAMGGVYLRAVLTDSVGNVVQVAEPIKSCSPEILGCYQDANGAKGVVLDSRVQTLTQALSNCVVTMPGVTGTGTCTFDLTTQLILETTSAHTFNFIFPNVGVGTYNVVIQAAVKADGTIGSTSVGTAIGGAAFGLGSLTVESVRLVHDFAF